MVVDNICDVVFVKQETFDRSQMKTIAEQVGQLNAKLVEENRPYVLIGFGRWGSSDPWLGIGVGWAEISGVSIMVEASLEDFRVDPSNGAHFFQNITSLGVGYLSIPYGSEEDQIDWDWLNSQPIETETEFLRHVRLDSPTLFRVNGRDRTAVGLK